MATDILQLVHVMHKVRKTLQREHRGYQRALFTRIGLPEGLSEAEFDLCVTLLEDQEWLTIDKGGLGRPILVFNRERTNTKIYSPEEVIAHAMQCPPITEELLNGTKTK